VDPFGVVVEERDAAVVVSGGTSSACETVFAGRLSSNDHSIPIGHSIPFVPFSSCDSSGKQVRGKFIVPGST
jgi:hypothetical protein